MLMINSFHWCTQYNVNCTFYISVRQYYTINHKFIFSTINISPVTRKVQGYWQEEGYREARTHLLRGLLGSVYVTGDEIDDIEGSNRQLGARTKDGGGSALVQKLVILNNKPCVKTI